MTERSEAQRSLKKRTYTHRTAKPMSSSGQYLSLTDGATLMPGSMYGDLLISTRPIRSWVANGLRLCQQFI